MEPRGSYPMRVVTRLTGLNPDTIRAWERRYGAISPERTGGNTRLFSAADVKRLALLRDIVALGHPVSRVATLDTPELEKLLKEDERQVVVPREEPPPVQGLGAFVDEYLGEVDRFEARKAHERLARSAALMATREFLLGVAAPVLKASHTRWAGRATAQGLLVRAQVARTVSSLPAIYPSERGAPRIVVASPLGGHEAAMQIAGALAMLSGLDVVYLGAGVDEEQILWAIDRSEPAMVLIAADATTLGAPEQAVLDRLAQRVPPRTQVWRCGAEASSDAPNVRRFASFEALEGALIDAG